LSDGCRGGDGDGSLDASLKSRHCLSSFVEESGRAIGNVEQRGAGGGETNLASAAIKEALAKLRFERLDLLGDRGLRDVESFRGAAKALARCYFTEDSQTKIFKHLEALRY
jgi:hypothetical protein